MSALITENTATGRTDLIDRELWSREFVELLVTQFLFGLSMSLFYLLPKYLRISLHASASQIGMVMGAGLVASVLATPLAAIWLRNGQRRMPARCGLLMLTCSALAYTQVTAIGPFLIGLRLVQGCAYTLFASAVVTRAAEIAPRERLAQAMGYVGLAALVTNALSPLIAEPMASKFGWSSVFTLAFVAGVGALIWTRTLNDQARHSTVNRRFAAHSIGQPLASVLYATMICGVALGVMFTFTQPLALERGAREVGPLFSGYVMAAAAVRLCLPKLADRLGRRRSAAVALIAYAATVAASAQLTPGTLLALGFCLGASHGVLYPALNALALERATKDNRSLVATVFGGAFNLGYAASVLGLGVVADNLGYPLVFRGTAVLVLSGAVALFHSGSGDNLA